MAEPDVKGAIGQYLAEFTHRAKATRFLVFPFVLFMVLRFPAIPRDSGFFLALSDVKPVQEILSEASALRGVSFLQLLIAFSITLVVDRFVELFERTVYNFCTATLSQSLQTGLLGQRFRDVSKGLKDTKENLHDMDGVRLSLQRKMARTLPDRRLAEILTAAAATIVVFETVTTWWECCCALLFCLAAICLYYRVFKVFIRDVAPLQMILEFNTSGIISLDLPPAIGDAELSKRSGKPVDIASAKK